MLRHLNTHFSLILGTNTFIDQQNLSNYRTLNRGNFFDKIVILLIKVNGVLISKGGSNISRNYWKIHHRVDIIHYYY